MASTFSTNLALELIGTGDQAGTWGNTTNTNLGTLLEQAISGYVTQAVSTGTDTTITIPNGSTGVARNMYIELTGTGGSNTNLVVPANKKLYFIFNNSTGAVTVKVSAQTGVSVPTGKKMVLVSNGTDIVNGINYIADFATNSFTVTNLTASSGTITNLIATSGSITNLVSSDASATVLRAGSATLTHLSATSASITNLALTSLTISSLSITNVSVASVTVSSIATFAAGSAAAPSITTTGDTNTGIFFPAADTIAFTEGGVEAARFDSSGNLGIGTSTPGSYLSGTAKLVAYANANAQNSILVRNDSSGASASCAIALNAFGNAWGIEIGSSAKNSNALTFQLDYGGTNSTKMTLDSSGNLGLGVTPSAWGSGLKALQVGANSYASLFDFDNGVTSLSSNLFWNGSAYSRISASSRWSFAYFQDTTNGAHSWVTSTAAGTSTPTMSTLMTLSVTGAGSNNTTLNLKGGAGGGSDVAKIDFERDGTAILGTIQLQRDGGNGAGALQFWTNGGSGNTERARIDSSGNLGIGTSSPGRKLDVVAIPASVSQLNGLRLQMSGVATSLSEFLLGTDASGVPFTSIRTGNDGNAFMTFFTGSGPAERARIDSSGNLGIGTSSPPSGSRLAISGGALNFTETSARDILWGTSSYVYITGNQGTGVLAMGTGSTERARIDSSGNLLVGVTSTTSTIINGVTEGGLAVQGKQTNGGASVVGFFNAEAVTGDGSPVLGISKAMTTTSSSARFVQFFAGGVSTTPMGGIVGNGASNVQFATLSDAREKTNVQPISGSLNKISALKPVAFDWIKSGEHVKAGFVAQDVEEIFPEFVVDNMSGEGEEIRKGLTGGMTGGIIPHLVKAIQEQQAIITQLTARVAQLESK